MSQYLKHLTLGLLIVGGSTIGLSRVQAQGVQAGIHFVNGNTLSIQAHPKQEVKTSLSGVQFVLRWAQTTPDFLLDDVIDTAFAIEEVGAGQKGGYNYKYYSGTPVPWVGVDWPGDTDVHELARVRVSGVGTVELAPSNYLEFGAGDWYIEFGGADLTNATFAVAQASNGSLPVELASFDADLNDRTVSLFWRTLSEEENAGFHVEHAEYEGKFEAKSFVAGAGTTNEVQTYSFQFEDLALGTHWFRLRQVDFDGTTSYSPIVEVDVTLPGLYALDPAFPNPFQEMTTLRFAVQQDQHVQMHLYDVQGRIVRLLYEGSLQGGRMYRVDLDGSSLSSGLYLVRMEGDDFVAGQKVLLTR